MLKNAYFLEKNCNNRLSIGTPACLWWLGALPPDPRFVTPTCYNSFFEFVSSAKSVLLPSKINKTTTVNVLLLLLLHFYTLFFTSNSILFVDGGALIFLAPGRRYPSYATVSICHPILAITYIIKSFKSVAQSLNFGSPRRKKFNNIQCFYKNSSFTSWNATKLDNWEDMILLQ